MVANVQARLDSVNLYKYLEQLTDRLNSVNLLSKCIANQIEVKGLLIMGYSSFFLIL